MITDLLKEVGRGKRGARDLTYEEAKRAAELILSLEATPVQIGAFLMAERIKMESIEELEAFVEVCRRSAYREPIHQGIDCAGPYDGRTKSFYASFATSFLLAAAGLPVTLHSAASLPPKWGITLQELVKGLGIAMEELSRESIIRSAVKTGILLVPAERWCPPLQKLRYLREQLGMRTILNTVEKMIDYSYSPYITYGVFHNTVFERTAKVLSSLQYRRALIVQGAEGSEDLYIHRPTRTYLVEEGEASLLVIDPETYGLDIPVPEKEWTVKEQLQTTYEVLQGGGHLACMNQVLLNGAVRLWLAEKVDSIEQGLYICKGIIDNGEAWSMFETWRRSMQSEHVSACVNEVECR